MFRSSAISALVFLTGLLTAVAAQPDSDRTANLFATIEPDPPARVTTQTDAASQLPQRFVRIDQTLLTAARLEAASVHSRPAVLRLNLLDDVVVNALVERTGPTSAGYWLSGHIEGWVPGSMTLVVNGEVIAGTVHTPGATYTIRSVGGGVYVIRQLDPVALECRESGSPAADERAEPGRAQPRQRVRLDSVSGGEVRPSEDGSRIDVLVVYTPAARDAEGGREHIEALIDLFVAETNQAYADSGVFQRINLVHTAQVDYGVVQNPDVGCLECVLRNPSDGYMDEVHGMRDVYGADLVALIPGSAYPYGGEARTMHDPSLEDASAQHAFSITRHNASGRTFAHELGHSMGLNHDRYTELVARGMNQPSPPNKPYPYSYGYVNQRAFEQNGPESSRWSTIMAYGTQCGNAGFRCYGIPRFSNPDLIWNDDPMGVPGDEPSSEVTGPADARRTLNATRHVVANFRLATQPITNHPPVVADVLAPLKIGVDDAPVTVEVASAFSDPDGDALTYSADSTDERVVKAGVAESLVSLEPVAAGEAEVKVTAEDGKGGSAEQVIAVVVFVGEPAPGDPSAFTGEDLEGQRLTLRLTGEEGTAGSIELRFGEDNRFEQIESIRQEAAILSAGTATRSEGTATRLGSYAYRRSGPGMGTVRLDYDDGGSCEIRLSFTGLGLGAYVYDCGLGEPAEGSFRLTTGSLFIPVILSAAGQRISFFSSELTLTNRGEREARLDYTYMAHTGGGSGTASEVLEAGRQKIEPDALDYLRRLGVPIPGTGNRIGTLRVEVPLGSEVEAVVRTTTVVPDGRAGLAYLGVAEEEGFDEAVYLCGLRQNARDRSNVAFQNMGLPEQGGITLRTTVYSGEAGDAGPRVLEEVKLRPGDFHQFNRVLEVLGSPAQGYVKVERVEGTAPFYTYGVINDQANSDGSFVFPVTAGSLEGRASQTLPVIVETSEFSSELTVTNFSEEARGLHFRFVAEGVRTPDRTAEFTLMPMRLEAGEQRILPDIVEGLRQREVGGIGSRRGGYAGAVFVTAEGGDMSGVVIGARTGSNGGGGQYSVFYNAVPEGEAFSEEAWVDGLQQNEENRSNLALVNTGEVDESESVFHLEIYDGETGTLAETVVTRPIPARRWHQINGILGSYAPETRQGYIRILKVSGKNPFLAYGVVNDGGAPGQRSGDGAYVPARE